MLFKYRYFIFRSAEIHVATITKKSDVVLATGLGNEKTYV